MAENLKSYVTTNTVKMGVGPEAWRSTTRLAKQEVVGAAVYSLHKDEEKPVKEEEETTEDNTTSGD